MSGDDDIERRIERRFEAATDAERELAVDIPQAPSVPEFETDENFEDAADVDGATLNAFVICVLLTNIAVMAVSLGPMLWYFEGMRRVGIGLILVGAFLFVRVYQHYRNWKATREADPGGGDTAESDAGDATAEADATEDADATESDAAAPADSETDSDDAPQR